MSSFASENKRKIMKTWKRIRKHYVKMDERNACDVEIYHRIILRRLLRMTSRLPTDVFNANGDGKYIKNDLHNIKMISK